MKPLLTVPQFLQAWVPVSLLLAAACLVAACRRRSAGRGGALGFVLCAVFLAAAWPLFSALHEGMGFDSVRGLLLLTALFAAAGALLGCLLRR